MADFYGEFMEFLKRPVVMETVVDILLCAVPIWVAVMIGLVIGWSWRPRWTGLLFLGMRSRLRFLWTAPPGFGARRLWFAFTAFSALSVCRKLWSNLRGKAEEGVGGGGGRSGGWLIGRMLTLSGSRNARQGLKKGEGAEVTDGSVTSQIVRTASNERVGDGFRSVGISLLVVIAFFFPSLLVFDCYIVVVVERIHWFDKLEGDLYCFGC